MLLELYLDNSNQDAEWIDQRCSCIDVVGYRQGLTCWLQHNPKQITITNAVRHKQNQGLNMQMLIKVCGYTSRSCFHLITRSTVSSLICINNVIQLITEKHRPVTRVQYVKWRSAQSFRHLKGIAQSRLLILEWWLRECGIINTGVLNASYRIDSESQISSHGLLLINTGVSYWKVNLYLISMTLKKLGSLVYGHTGRPYDSQNYLHLGQACLVIPMIVIQVQCCACSTTALLTIGMTGLVWLQHNAKINKK